ncbi:hypothetical protein OQA88_8199 [Cercophora sp. LCS_1]
MVVQQHVLNWLYSVLTSEYHDVNRTYNDVAQALSQYPSLSPRTDVHTFPSGASALLLHLSGTIPVVFRGTTYRFPISLWVPHAYPREAPLVYVTPTETMMVRPGQHVDPQGQVYHPYLVGWSTFWDKSSVLDFLAILRDIFAKEPPVIARQQGRPSPSVQQQTAAPPPVPPLPPDLARPPTNNIQPPPQEDAASPPPPPPKPGARFEAQPPPGPGPSTGPPLPPHPSASGPPVDQYAPEFSRARQEQRLSRYDTAPPLPPQSPPQPQPPARTSFSPQAQAHAQHPPHPAAQYQGYPPPSFSPVGFPPNPPQAAFPPTDPRHPAYAQTQAYNTPPPGWQQPPPPPPQAIQHQAPPQPTPKPPPPPDLMDEDLTLAIPSSNVPAPPIPPNPEKDALLHQLARTLYDHRQRVRAQNEASLQGLEAQRAAMQSAASRIQTESAQLTQLSALLTSNTAVLQDSLRRADGVIANAAKHPEPSIDELLVAPTVVGNQLYELVAEERALADAIFVLGRAVERGRIAPQTFAKMTRSLAREWYLKKALVRKIGVGMGLSAY